MRHRLLAFAGGGLVWSGRSSTWRCAAALSWSCSASARRRPRDRDPGITPGARGAAPPISTAPPAAHRPCAARGAEPAAPTGTMVDLPGATRDSAALAPAYGPLALDLPENLHRPTADLRRGAADHRPARPRESTVGLPTHPTASCCALASGCQPARSGGCCAPTILTRRPGALQRAGGRSCASRPPGSWPATSLPSTRSSSSACMCCLLSNSQADGCTWPASLLTRLDGGLPSKLAT